MTEALTLLKGPVKNLKVEKATKDFFNDRLQAKAGAVAVGAAALGSFFAASVLTSVSTNAYNRVEVFTCTVNGIELSGCLEEITFHEGDEIEFVVEYNPENQLEASVHAARDTAKKILWVIPYQHQGEIAHQKSNFSFSWKMSMFGGFLIAILGSIGEWSSGSFSPNFFTTILICSVLGGGGAFLLFTFFGKQTITHSKRATKVFKALGYANPTQVDTPKNHFEADEKWGEENGGKYGEIPQLYISRYQDSDLTK